ncbi:CLIP-associating protein 1 [Fasciola hepatica]|uniref:CLIP-associating protein 1 n=1 Tax=Fasciola hepatica TaxID=6192 RepID=A0A4E0RUN0_FASHE|nr:CLIP-associating protein 1 [Fasciola hepatica]
MFPPGTSNASETPVVEYRKPPGILNAEGPAPAMSRHASDGAERKHFGSLKSSASADVSMERKRSTGENQGVGAVDEDVFHQSFVPAMSISAYSSKELTEILGRLKETLSGNPEEWEKRVDALKTLRALLANGAAQFEEFAMLLKTLEVPVDACLRDLRSAVVREACITVAYFSQELKNRFDRFAEAVLQTLIVLLSNSAKIMASSANVAIRFILENTHSPRLFPILVGSLSSKSSVTRKCVCEFLEIIFRVWPLNVLEKHVALLQDSLKKGINDADQEARMFARRAFPLFAAKFPDQANSLLQNLDAQKRKLIEKDLISAGMSGSIMSGDNGTAARSRSNSQTTMAPRSAVTNPVTRRPTRPVLGTVAATVTGARPRPPITTQNEYGTIGRYTRHGSVAPTVDTRSRLSTRKKVSQSQPTSREVSPSRFTYASYGISNDSQGMSYNASGYASRNGLMGHTAGNAGYIPSEGGLINSTYRPPVSSRIPRSQGASREGSPTRSVASGYSAASYQNHSQLSQPSPMSRLGQANSSYRTRQRPSLSSMSDCGDMGDPFHSRHLESDDNFSETSSQCSDRSSRSAAGFRRQQSMRVTGNLKEIMALLSGTQWSDRKDGLVNLQNYMRSGSALSPDDIKRLTDAFNKMFADSQSKVVSLFMDTLQFFIKEYNPMLRDWLYTLLIRLLHRQSHEVLGSHQKAIQETLFVLRSHFPLNVQFVTCCHFVMDNTQAPNSKVKVCLLEYLKDLILMMNPDAIAAPTPEMNLAISRIISWSTEPKSADVRRMASRVIIKLYDLNTSSFSAILQSLPRASQERASEILKTYQKTTTGGGRMDSNLSTGSWRAPSVDQSDHILSPIDIGQSVYPPGDRNHMSPETVNSLIRQASEGIQSLTCGISSGIPTPQRRVSETGLMRSPMGYSPRADSQLSQPAGRVEPTNAVLRTMQPSNIISSPGPIQSTMLEPAPVANSYATPPVPLSDDPSQYNPAQQTRSNKLGGIFEQGDGPKLKKPVIGYQTLRKIREMPPEDIMSEILQELSNHNERHEQRKGCMLKLIKLLRDGVIQDWDEYFKPTLLILLETLGDDGVETRALALKVLQELVRTKPDLFHEFACLFVIKVLEACRDGEKTVNRAAEECSKVVAQCLPPDLCLSVLTPLINDWSLQINLPAVKMQEQVVRNAPEPLVSQVVDTIIPGLIVACNHEDSAMRKASIFCLVAIASKLGDVIWDHLTEMHVSKKRLLKLYIDREQASKTNSHESLGARS